MKQLPSAEQARTLVDKNSEITYKKAMEDFWLAVVNEVGIAIDNKMYSATVRVNGDLDEAQVFSAKQELENEGYTVRVVRDSGILGKDYIKPATIHFRLFW